MSELRLLEGEHLILDVSPTMSGVVVKEMGAVPNYVYPYWYGVEWGFPTMVAVPNPEEMQKQILELIGKKGKESKLTV
ncbi:MAG: hypothetical protein QXH91_08960 [Candidatus Bathyarchaeia archaeon]